MEFRPLYFAEKLRVVNPHATIGICTLWSAPEYVMAQLERAGADFNPETSKIAVVGTLYGNGLREMLRNLLCNPQIRTVYLLGRDKSGSGGELRAFFNGNFHFLDDTIRLSETGRILDSAVLPSTFGEVKPRIVLVGTDPTNREQVKRLAEAINAYVPEPHPAPERREVPLPEVEVKTFPSTPQNHSIVSDDPYRAWLELIRRVDRFGIPVELPKGPRKELQNVRVVVEKPWETDLSHAAWFGISKESIREYRADLLNGEIRPDEPYNYGHRLRSYFWVDTLGAVAKRLQSDPQDRKGYVTTWDVANDLYSPHGTPCMVSLYFRKFEGLLTLSAVFRTHNAPDAWLMNFFGLLALQEHVCSECDLSPGAITILSHSLTIDLTQQFRVNELLKEYRIGRLKPDPNGYFLIGVQNGLIEARHYLADRVAKVYVGDRARSLQFQIIEDMAVSDLNHALYLGRQLGRAEMCIRHHLVFRQD